MHKAFVWKGLVKKQQQKTKNIKKKTCGKRQAEYATSYPDLLSRSGPERRAMGMLRVLVKGDLSASASAKTQHIKLSS